MKTNVFVVCSKEEAKNIKDRIYPDIMYAADSIHYFVPNYKLDNDSVILKITIELDPNYQNKYIEEDNKDSIKSDGVYDIGWGDAFYAYPCQVIKYYFTKSYLEKFTVCTNYVDRGFIEAIAAYCNDPNKKPMDEWEFDYGIVHMPYKKEMDTNDKYDINYT